MDRPFTILIGGAAVIGFATIWAATGIVLTPSPAPVVVPPPPPPSGPAHPDAASPLTVPVRVDGTTTSAGSSPVAPLDPNAAALQPSPATSGSDTAPIPTAPTPTDGGSNDGGSNDGGGPPPQNLPAAQ